MSDELVLIIMGICNGIFFIAVATPLIQRKISLNGFYGLRTKKSVSSEKIWYDINVYFGKKMAIAGFSTIILSSAMYFIIGQISLDVFAILCSVVLFLPLTIAITISALHLQRFSVESDI